METQRKTAFVTGATGFLGLNLVEQLALDGWRVFAMHRTGSDLSVLGTLKAERIVCDVLDLEDLKRLMPDNIDCVFHAAADTSVWSRDKARQLRINVDGTRNVVTAARARGAKRLVHTSSCLVFGVGVAAVNESMPRRGQSSWIGYVRSKYFAERVAVTANTRGLPVVIVNPAHILGRYDTHNWARMILLADQGRLPFVPPGSGTFNHSVAVARAHIEAATRGRPGENYLLSGVTASYRNVVRAIGRALGKPVNARVVPPTILKAYARLASGMALLTGREPQVTPEAAAMVTSHGSVASDKAARELGYVDASLDTMVEDAVAWLRQSGRIGPTRKT